jgi:predicted RNase H-like HicB family nuclease
LGESDFVNLKSFKYDYLLSKYIIISKEGKWFVASCPLLDISTQGKTEQEVKENMEI